MRSQDLKEGLQSEFEKLKASGDAPTGPAGESMYTPRTFGSFTPRSRKAAGLMGAIMSVYAATMEKHGITDQSSFDVSVMEHGQDAELMALVQDLDTFVRSYLEEGDAAPKASEEGMSKSVVLQILGDMCEAMATAVTRAVMDDNAAASVGGANTPFTPRTMGSMTPRSRLSVSVTAVAAAEQEKVLAKYGLTDPFQFGYAVQELMGDADVIAELQRMEQCVTLAFLKATAEKMQAEANKQLGKDLVIQTITDMSAAVVKAIKDVPASGAAAGAVPEAAAMPFTPRSMETLTPRTQKGLLQLKETMAAAARAQAEVLAAKGVTDAEFSALCHQLISDSDVMQCMIAFETSVQQAYLDCTGEAEEEAAPSDTPAADPNTVDADTLVKMLNEMASSLQTAVENAQAAEEGGGAAEGDSAYVPFTPRTMASYTPRSRTALAVSEMAGQAQNNIMNKYGFTDPAVFGMCVQQHMQDADVLKALQGFEMTAKNAMDQVESGPTTI